MDYAFLQPWHRFLPRDGGHVVSFFGGGGKTSLMLACAAALRAEGVPVAVTTTTRTEPLAVPGLAVAEWDDLVSERKRRAPPLLAIRNGSHTDGKWRGLASAQVDELSRSLKEHVVLVEADGSAKRPLKLHRPDEPVWPARTSLAVAVLGLSAIGRPLREVLHRHGELSASWLPGDPDALWTWDLMAHLVESPGGYLARVPVGVPVVAALTQVAGCTDAIALFAGLDRLMTAVPIVLVGELSGDSPAIRAAYRRGRAGVPDDGGTL